MAAFKQQVSRRYRPWRLLLLALVLTPPMPACASSGSETRLDPGNWGGRGAALTVTQTGAELKFDCAHATITEPVVVQADGQFSASGEFVRERGGPVRLNEPPAKGEPAVISGEVNPPELQLTVELPDRGQTLGPFTLIRSQQAILRRCF